MCDESLNESEFYTYVSLKTEVNKLPGKLPECNIQDGN